MSKAIKLTLVGFAAGLVLGGGAVAANAFSSGGSKVAPTGQPVGDTGSTDPRSYSGEIAFSDFPTNTSGMTYGSDARATSAKEVPDLVAIVGDKGIVGFALAADLYPEIKSPEDAIAYENRLKTNGPRVVDVYDVEAQTVVDVSTEDVGGVSYEPEVVK